MKRVHPRHRRPSGFTLIELLVVVAIIALLIAILLPSLSKARENARTVVCGTHMRAIAMAHLMYAEDNHGRLCIGSVQTGNNYYPNGWFWATQLVQQNYIGAANNVAPAGGQIGAVPRGIFYCPDGTVAATSTLGTEDYPRSLYNYSYGFNGTTNPGDVGIFSWYQVNMSNLSAGNDTLNQSSKGAATPFINFNAAGNAGNGDGKDLASTSSYLRTRQFITADAKMVMLMESPNTNVYFSPTTYSNAERLAARHGDTLSNKISPIPGTDGYTNFAFFDGHVSKFSTVPYSNSGYNVPINNKPTSPVPDTLFTIQQQ